MTDVVEIARSRRSRLVAEIAKLDDFISTAETLLRLEKDTAAGNGWLTGKKASGPSDAESADAEGDRGNVKAARDGADDGGEKAEADPGLPDPASMDAGSLDPASLEPGGERDRNLFAPAFGEKAELLLDDKRSSDGAEDEAGFDAAIGQKLRQRRWMMGMTKRQLAEKLGIGVEEVQNFELGLAHIGTGRIWELATALGVPTSYFFENEESSTETRHSSGGKPAPTASREVALANTA